MSNKANLPDLSWKTDIPRMDDGLLKDRLSALPAGTQIEVVTSLGWDDRLKVIKNSNAAREIVQGLPAEEVFLTVKGAGEGDALSLVGLTSPDQLRFILDMELWTGDRLDGARARQWLMSVLACGEEKVIELLEHCDRELLTIMMSKLVTLVPNEEGVTVPQGLSSIMPDEFFTILSSVPEETENMRLLLRIIRQWDRDRFYELLFDIYGKSGTEAEEGALRWRNSRLEEKGLLEFDEAIEIYAYRSKPGKWPRKHWPEHERRRQRRWRRVGIRMGRRYIQWFWRTRGRCFTGPWFQSMICQSRTDSAAR
jgi:hypothetical protein